MKKTRTQKGITLIALIITIVVLLILAAVAIASIQNDGILKYAQNAADAWNKAQTNEQAMLGDYLNYLNNMGSSSIPGIWTQNGTTVTNGTVTLAVGTTVTGYDAGVESYTGGWAVLGAEDGKLLLVSKNNLPDEVFIGNSTLLNKMCGEYLNTTLADEARSITVEDINRITGYNPEVTGDGNPYGYGEVVQYGNEVTYTKNSEGMIVYTSNVKSGISTHSGFYILAGESLTAEMTEGITITSSAYRYYPNTLTANSNEDTGVGILTSSEAYTVLFSNTGINSGSYWLDSPFVQAGEGYAYWGNLAVLDSKVDYYYDVYSSLSGGSGAQSGVRAVVSIKSDIPVTKTESNTWYVGYPS